MILNADATFSLRRAAADVEEVRRLHAVELDDVHRRHGEAGAVDHAADRAVERDVVEIVLRGFDLLGVLFGDVAQCRHVGMAEQRVVVEADLGVEADQLLVLGDDQRIHFEQAHVLLGERLVEAGEQRAHLLLQIGIEAERLGDAPHVMRADAGHRIDRDRDDLVGRVVRDLLDVHAAFGRDHDRDARGLAVEQHRQIELLVDRGAVLDVEPVDDLALRSGLVRHQGRAEDARRFLLHVVDRFHDLDAAGLAAAAGVDLRLHHPDRTAELLGGASRPHRR